MPDKINNLKSYRQALEALVSHQTEAKMSALLGSAAANLDDPWLRDKLKLLINNISISHLTDKYPKRITEMVGFMDGYPSHTHAEELVDELIEYIERIIDAEDAAWEIIAIEYGWQPPEDD